MARTIHTRMASRSVLGKRRRTFGGGSRFKRRRFTRKKTANFSTRSIGGAGLQFRSRKLTRRRWNNALWNSTLQAKHYRSTAAATLQFTSPTTQVSMNMGFIAARRFGGLNFWETAGGAINPDGGVMPTFISNGDIVVRGGTMGFRMTNKVDSLEGAHEAIQVTLFLVRTGNAFNGGLITGTVNVGWDPTLIPDFKINVGRILFRKKFLLRDQDVATYEYRMPIQKLDSSEYATTLNDYIWIVMVGNTDTVEARSIQVTTYFNMSFTGDVV